MDVTSFFTRLIQPPKGKGKEKAIDDIADFDAAWNGIKVGRMRRSQVRAGLTPGCTGAAGRAAAVQASKSILLQVGADSRGIFATNVPAQLELLVSALVYEAGRADEEYVAQLRDLYGILR
jgi:hypothetical protein